MKEIKKKEFVYILTHNIHQHVVKIGETKDHPEVRKNTLDRATPNIGKFKVEWFKEVQNSKLTETLIKGLLEEYREPDKKEFFRILLPSAIDICEKVVEYVEKIELFVSEQMALENHVRKLKFEFNDKLKNVSSEQYGGIPKDMLK